MFIRKIILRIGVIFLIILFSISCSTFQKIDGIDFTKLELQAGDSVNIVTKSNEQVTMVVRETDSEYLYGENEDVIIRKDNIESMELSGFYPGKITFYVLCLMLFSLFFSG